MGTKKFKPTTPSRRFMSGSDFTEVTTAKPEKSLVKSSKRSSGRNNRGRITMRRRGGGHKRRYRLVDLAFTDSPSLARPRLLAPGMVVTG